MTGNYWITPRQAEAWRLKRAGLRTGAIAQKLDVSRTQVRRLLARVERELTKDRSAPLRAHAARVDATQPDDPPRGVWIEK